MTEKNVMLRPALETRAMSKLREAMTPRDIPADHVFDTDWLAKRAQANKAKAHMRLHVQTVASAVQEGANVRMSEQPDGSYIGAAKFECGDEVEIIVKPRQRPVAVISMDII